jgi:hypothetical protein
MVQNGRAEYDPSTTIKAAIDGSMISGGKWEAFKDERGRQYVKYTAHITDSSTLDRFKFTTNDFTIYNAIVDRLVRQYHTLGLEGVYEFVDNNLYVILNVAGIAISDKFKLSHDHVDKIVSWHDNVLVPGFTEKGNVEGKRYISHYNLPNGVEYSALNFHTLIMSTPQQFDPGKFVDLTFIAGWLMGEGTSFSFIDGIMYYTYEFDDGRGTAITSNDIPVSAETIMQIVYEQ